MYMHYGHVGATLHRGTKSHVGISRPTCTLLTSLFYFSSKGHTPLSCAAESGHHETMMCLLGEKGVSPNGCKNEEKQKKVPFYVQI